MKLYNFTPSVDCYKVRLLLGFLQVECELVTENYLTGGEVRDTDFDLINPIRQLPYLEDGDFRTGSLVDILRHIAEKCDSARTWLPQKEVEFDKVMAGVVFANSQLKAAAEARLHYLINFPGEPEHCQSAARVAFETLENHFAERSVLGKRWYATDLPTIADVCCFPDIALSGDAGIGHEPFPYLRNWMRTFRRLPHFKAAPGIPDFV